MARRGAVAVSLPTGSITSQGEPSLAIHQPSSRSTSDRTNIDYGVTVMNQTALLIRAQITEEIGGSMQRTHAEFNAKYEELGLKIQDLADNFISLTNVMVGAIRHPTLLPKGRIHSIKECDQEMEYASAGKKVGRGRQTTQSQQILNAIKLALCSTIGKNPELLAEFIRIPGVLKATTSRRRRTTNRGRRVLIDTEPQDGFSLQEFQEHGQELYKRMYRLAKATFVSSYRVQQQGLQTNSLDSIRNLYEEDNPEEDQDDAAGVGTADDDSDSARFKEGDEVELFGLITLSDREESFDNLEKDVSYRQAAYGRVLHVDPDYVLDGRRLGKKHISVKITKVVSDGHRLYLPKNPMNGKRFAEFTNQEVFLPVEYIC